MGRLRAQNPATSTCSCAEYTFLQDLQPGDRKILQNLYTPEGLRRRVQGQTGGFKGRQEGSSAGSDKELGKPSTPQPLSPGPLAPWPLGLLFLRP